MKCKHCGSEEVVKYGIDYQGGETQRYLCKDCGRTFTEEIEENKKEEGD